jgi:hypothetical protein
MDQGILEAGRAIRPYLESLTGPRAAELDDRIAGLLAADAAGEDVEAELRSLLLTDRATAVFVEEVLTDAPHYRPPALQPGYETPVERGPGGDAPPGSVGVIAPSGKFVCPNGDYVWYRRSVGAVIPNCPTHGVGLTPA